MGSWAAGGLGPVCKVRDKGASLWGRERERDFAVGAEFSKQSDLDFAKHSSPYP